MGRHSRRALRAGIVSNSNRIFVGDRGTVLRLSPNSNSSTLGSVLVPTDFSVNLNGIAASESNIIAVGQYGTIVKAEITDPWQKVSDGLYTIPKINAAASFNSDAKAVLVGNSGFSAVMKIPDGLFYTLRQNNFNEDIYGIDTGNSTTGSWMACGSNGTVFKANETDGIITVQHIPGVTATLRGVSVYGNYNRASVVGDNGVVMTAISQNDMASWQDIRPVGLTADMYAIHREGVAALTIGGTGKIYISSNDGDTWIDVTPGGLGGDTVKAFSKIVSSYMWAVCTGGKTFVSTDSGSTWAAPATASGVSDDLNAVILQDLGASGKQAIIVGDNGTILKVTDLGASSSDWINYTSNSVTTSDLVAVVGDSSDVAVIGSDGTVIKSKTYGSDQFTDLMNGGIASPSINFLSNSSNFAVGTNGSTFRTVDTGVSWIKIAEDGTTLNDISQSPFDSTIAWAVGNNNTIKRTTDNGSSWTSSSFGGGNFLQTRVISDSEAFVTYTNGTFYGNLRTTDSGSSYARMPSVVNLRALAEVPSSSTVFLADNLIFKSTDTGSTFILQGIPTSVASVTFQSAYFVDVNTGWMGTTDGKLLKTIDGGTTWTTLTSPGPSEPVFNIYFNPSDTQKGWVTSKPNSWKQIRRTTDGGQTWSTALVIIGTTGTAEYDIRFVDANNGFATTEFTNPTLSIYKTINGGTSWDSAYVSNDIIQSVFPITTLSGNITVYACGNNTAVVKSTNGGVDWSNITTGLPGATTWNSIWFIDDNDDNTGNDVGWVVGAGGNVYKTIDGGANWASQTSGVTEILFRIKMADASNGYISGEDGALLRTTNGGANWTKVSQPPTAFFIELAAVGTTLWSHSILGSIVKSTDSGATWSGGFGADSGNTINDIFFATALIGFSVRADGDIEKTADGGTVWVEKKTNGGALNDIHFLPGDSNFGVAVGDSGDIWVTTDVGETWADRTTGSANFNSVYVYSGTGPGYGDGIAVAVGDGGVVYRTVNGGVTWTNLSPTYQDMYFLNSMVGWAVGNSGLIQKTINGGQSWVKQNSGVSPTFLTVYAIDFNAVYVGGGSSNIRKTTDGGTTWADADPNNELEAGSQIRDIYFIDVDTGLAGLRTAPFTGKIFKTTNGGTDWAEVFSSWEVWGIDRDTNGDFIQVGIVGMLQRSIDNGDTWASVAPDATGNYRAFAFGGTVGMAVGDVGITSYWDGASFTDRAAIAGTPDLKDVYVESANKIIAVASDGKAYMTTDQGVTWAADMPFTSSSPPGALNAIVGPVPEQVFTAGVTWLQIRTDEEWNFFKVRDGTGNYSPTVGTGSKTIGNATGISIDSSGDGHISFSNGAIYILNNWKPERDEFDIAWSYPVNALKTDGSGLTATSYHFGTKGRVWSFKNESSPIVQSHTSPIRDALKGAYKDGSTWWMCGTNGLLVSTTNLDISFNYTAYNSETVQDLNDIFFTGSTAYVCGNNAVVRKSTDSGATWSNPGGTGLSGSLVKVYFDDATTGWVASTANVFKTVDGGANWTAATGISGTVKNLLFTSSTTGYVVTTDSTPGIYNTTDGGATFSAITSGAAPVFKDWYAISVPSSNDIIVAGNNLNVTRTWDGGTNWVVVSSGHILSISYSASDSSLWAGGNGILMSSSTGGYTWQGRNSIFTSQASEKVYTSVQALSSDSAHVANNQKWMKTTDTGQTWADSTGLDDTNYRIKSVHFIGDNGLAASANTGFSNKITYTTNGGTDWAVGFSIGLAIGFWDVFLVDGSTGWAVGQFSTSGQIFKTTDSGISWDQQLNGGGAFYAVHFADSNTGWAVGALGTIYSTTDGGTNWTMQNSRVTVDLHDVYARTKLEVWAVGNNSTVLRTINGGRTWKKLGVVESHDFYSITFSDGDVGWIAGKDGIVLRTTGGGIRWRAVISEKSAVVNVYNSSGLLKFRRNSITRAMQEAEDGDIIQPASNATWHKEDVTFPPFKDVTLSGFMIEGTITKTSGLPNFRGISKNFLVADNGDIYRTLDNGVSWSKVATDSVALESVSQSPTSGSQVVYAVGADARVKKSKDFGHTWDNIPLYSVTADFVHVQATSDSIAYLSSNNSVLLQTTNSELIKRISGSSVIHALGAKGNSVWVADYFPHKSLNQGNTFIAMNRPKLSDNSYIQSAYVYSDNITYLGDNDGNYFKTFDGGKSWTLLNLKSGTDPVYDIFFKTTSKGWAILPDGINIRVYRTTDSGTTWANNIPTGSGSSAEILAGMFPKVHSPDGNIVFVGGKRYLWRSPDGGVSWTRVFDGAGNFRYQTMFATDTTTIYAFGDNGLRNKSIDGGFTWGPVSTTDLPGGAEWKTCWFSNSTTGWIAGYDTTSTSGPEGGMIYKTTNGGSDWAMQVEGLLDITIYRINIVNGNLGYATGDRGMILKTTDGGTNWTNINKANRGQFNTFVIDGSTIWSYATGGFATNLVKSTDSGVTWTLLNSNSVLTDLHNVDSTTLFGCGVIGRIVKSTDTGDTWAVKHDIDPDKFLTSIHFLDSNFGIAVGESGTIRVSTDGGETWASRDTGSEHLRGVYVYSGTGASYSDGVAVAVGVNGTILRTTDGGVNWASVSGKAAIHHSMIRGKVTSFTAGTDEIYNCTFFRVGGILDGTINGTDGTGSTTFKNNLLVNDFGSSGDAPSTVDTTNKIVSMGSAHADVGNYFVNTFFMDYHLKSTATLAIDTGLTIPPILAIDIDGNSRPSGSAWDIGADEYVSSNVTLTAIKNSGGSDLNMGDVQQVFVAIGSVTHSSTSYLQAVLVPSRNGTLYLVDSDSREVITTYQTASSNPYPIMKVYVISIPGSPPKWELYLLVDSNNNGFADGIQIVRMDDGGAGSVTFTNITPNITSGNTRTFDPSGDPVLRVPWDGSSSPTGRMNSAVFRIIAGEIDSSFGSSNGRRLFVVSNDTLYKINADSADTGAGSNGTQFGEIVWQTNSRGFNWRTPMSFSQNDLFIGLIDDSSASTFKNYLIARVPQGGTVAPSTIASWSSRFGEKDNRYGHFMQGFSSVSNIYVAARDGTRVYGIRADSADDAYRFGFPSTDMGKNATSLPVKAGSFQFLLIGSEDRLQKLIDKGDGDSDTGKLAQHAGTPDSDWPLGKDGKIKGNILKYIMIRDGKVYFATDEGYLYCYNLDTTLANTAGDETIVPGFPLRVPGGRINQIFGWYSGNAAGIYIATTMGGMFKVPWQ